MKPIEEVAITDDWLQDRALQTLFDILCADGGEAMVAGGAVRNALMGMKVADIDVSTTLLPQDVVQRVEAAGHKAVPTGIDHGTITAVVDGQGFEVTTLREDIETDGRHAVVRFGTNWQRDAERRDLTINALYCDRDGRVFDFANGHADIADRLIRFIGDPEARIREDSLRILRFFRFFAWYGGGRPDATALKACTARRMLMSGLSVERVWMEMKKLLCAPDPSRALLWMRTTGVLGGILPESAKWGIDAIPGLMRLEKAQGWAPDYMLRLMAMIRPHSETVAGLAARMLLSNAERERLEKWAVSQVPKPGISTGALEKLLYRGSQQGIIDAMKLEIVHLQNREDENGAEQMTALVAHASGWQKPEFPVKGRDLIEAGMQPGEALGERLNALEEEWVESGFQLGKGELLGC